MPDDRRTAEPPAPVERRAAALERAFEERNLIPAGFVDDFAQIDEEDGVPANAAKVVVRAWNDTNFKRRLLENGKATVAELGLTMREHHKHLVVLENTFNVQNFCARCARARRSRLAYLSACYYERSLTGLALVTREELEQLAGGSFPLSLPSAEGRLNAAPREDFKVGDKVRVKNEFISGHARRPGYIRGKTGVVVGVSPTYRFPDAAAHNLQAQDEPTYDVRFRTEDLWSQAADAGGRACRRL
jgi:nitrile hydratase subunit beta